MKHSVSRLCIKLIIEGQTKEILLNLANYKTDVHIETRKFILFLVSYEGLIETSNLTRMMIYSTMICICLSNKYYQLQHRYFFNQKT